MKKVLLILSLGIFLACKPENKNARSVDKWQKPTQLVDNKTIYKFLNNILENDSSIKYCNNIYNRDLLPYPSKEDSLTIIKLDSTFTKEDIAFIFQQARYSYFFKLDQKYLPNKKIIELDTIKAYNSNHVISQAYWESNLKKYGYTCGLSLPLFSVDRKKVIISFGRSCGMLCGHGGMLIFKKEGNKWILLTTVSEWVS